MLKPHHVLLLVSLLQDGGTDVAATQRSHSVVRNPARYPKEYAKSCAFSTKGMEVVVGEERGMYFVRINPRPDKCGWAPGTVLGFDVFELYAVSPEGRVLARYPSMP